jgi:hypothetical protein
MMLESSRYVYVSVIDAIKLSNNMRVCIRKDWLFKVGIFLLSHSQQSFPFLV